MLSALGAALRISLLRTRADWLIVAAAWLITLLATTLLAAGPIYAGAVSIAGLQRVLVDAPVVEANVQVLIRTDPARVDDVDHVVTPELERSFAGIGADVARFARSETFALPGQPADQVRSLAILGSADGVEQRSTLLDGAWPQTVVAEEVPLPVALAEPLAATLGLSVGDELELESRLREGFILTIAVAGIFRIDEPSDPWWWGEQQVLEGTTSSQAFDTHGPLITTTGNLVSRASPGRVQLGWRAFPDFESLTTDHTTALGSRVAALEDRIESQLGGAGSVSVTTDLPEMLAAAERSLLVSRTGVLLLTAQLAVLAAYAILLTAALLVDHRRVDTALLRSRGAGAGQVAGMAVAEGLLLTVPAGLAGPWLAAVALQAFNLTGPLAEIGLRIDPVVTTDAYAAAGIAAAACLLALALPALLAARSYAAVHGAISRGETRTIGQRLGLDLALLAVAGIGLWQLRHYGAPLTRSVQGTLGLDPLLVAAPAIGLLAGAVLALRLVPLLAQLIERGVVRGRGLVSALGARQLARRPLRYTRAALLLMLAMAMGLFAISYSRTWIASQRDQASYQVGADVRVVPGRQMASMPRWALDQGYAALPGVEQRMALRRERVQISRSAGQGALLALHADEAPEVVVLRGDLADQPVASLVAPLDEARPRLDLPRLPGEPRQLRMHVSVEIDQLERPVWDGEAFVDEEVDPQVLAGQRGIAAWVVVRDARGLLHRFFSEPVSFGEGARELVVNLGDSGDSGLALSHPLELVAVEVSVALPRLYRAPVAEISVEGAEAADDTGRWQELTLSVDGGWRLAVSNQGSRPRSVPGAILGPTLSAGTGDEGFGPLTGVDQIGRGVVLSFAPASLVDVAGAPVPVIANDAFATATETAAGDEVSVRIGGVQRRLRVTGVVRSFPTADPAEPTLVMDLSTLLLLKFQGTRDVDPPSEWWLSVDDGSSEQVAAALRRAPFGSQEVLAIESRTRTLATDPVALGIIGALTLGFVAAALFALVGFMVSAAVSARERLTEFALLRALGLSRGQLSGWLSLENATLVVVSLVAGSGLGLAIAWVVLPFVTVTQQATVPMPPVQVEVPWLTILVLEVVGLAALAVAVAVLAWLLRRIGLGSVLRMGED